MICRCCHWRTADMPKAAPVVCLLCYGRLPILQPAGPRIQAPRLRVVRGLP